MIRQSIGSECENDIKNKTSLCLKQANSEISSSLDQPAVICDNIGIPISYMTAGTENVAEKYGLKGWVN